MSNWPHHGIERAGPHSDPLPPLHPQERFSKKDLEEIADVYRRAGAARPPEIESLRWLIAESDLTIALREGGPSGPLRAFARVLTDFSRVAVVVEAVADCQGRHRDRLRACVVSAALSHPLLQEVARLEVLPEREPVVAPVAFPGRRVEGRPGA
jgi:hypothetical protein